MRKMKKQAVCLISSLAIGLGLLAGCGAKKTETAQEPAAETAQAETEQAQPAEEAAKEQTIEATLVSFSGQEIVVEYEGKTYTGQTNIGFDPYSIRPTTTLPDDFSAFWEKEKAKAAEVPMLVKERYCPEQSDDRVDVYYVRIQSFRKGNVS